MSRPCLVIDSSGLAPADLRRVMLESLQLAQAEPMPVYVISFPTGMVYLKRPIR